MKQGKSETPRRRKTRPAKSNGEALGRWGFRGKPTAGQPAYTAEHFEADVESGAIIIPTRECPTRRPDRDCPVSTYPETYRSTWTRYEKVGRWTRDGERPRRIKFLQAVPICFDCRMAMYYAERQDAFLKLGYDHGLGYIRPAEFVRREWGEQGDIARAGEDLYERERADLLNLAGPPVAETDATPYYLPRYEQAVLLSFVRHCLEKYFAARNGVSGPPAKVRHLQAG